MSRPPEPRAPAVYELRLRGHLDDHWSAWLGATDIVREADGTTTLRGPLADQAALHGLLARVRDLGVPLIAVTTVDPRGATPPVGGST